ncbi:MAG: response regulator [Lachnospiraceae bacterium]|nr:response regulator [Lachnospiraceae bacterium]
MYKGLEKEKILIVDDVETNRLVLEEIISSMGCQPILAESGQQALEIMKEAPPNLLITDISMPGMDGYDLCRRLKEDEDLKNIPVIFISAFDDTEDIVEGFVLGGEDYITKPFIPEIVQARVGVHLRLHVMKRELMETNRRLQVSVSEQLKQMEQEKKNVLNVLANVAAQNSHYKKEHMERLSHNCRVLAQAMQLSPLFEGSISDTFVDTIEIAAPLCDIGNIGIPKEILLKKELTEEDILIIQNHTNLGAEFLDALYANNDYNDFISTSIDIVRYHHENWDGSGYPEQLSKDEIPLAAQIVSMMDRYSTLAGEEGYTREEILDTMDKEAGVKFNPDIFGICRKISRQLS